MIAIQVLQGSQYVTVFIQFHHKPVELRRWLQKFRQLGDDILEKGFGVQAIQLRVPCGGQCQPESAMAAAGNAVWETGQVVDEYVQLSLLGPFQLEDKYITFKSAPQLTVQVVGSGKKENGQPFHFSVKVEKARCENDGFSVTLLSADFPVREVEYVDINYLAITNCRGEACSSPPPCGSCCLR